MLQRKLLVSRTTSELTTETTEEDVYNSTDLFRFINDPAVVRVEMIWDRVLGDKPMVLKEAKVSVPR